MNYACSCKILIQNQLGHKILTYLLIAFRNLIFKPRVAQIAMVMDYLSCSSKIVTTVMNLSLWTDRSGQTVQTQIRLPLEEQSDQGLHCLLFHLHHFDKVP